MGIDLELCFTLEKEPSEEFMIRANNLFSDTCELFQPDYNPISKVTEEDFYYELIKNGEVIENENTYTCYTLCRYYGIGYERGPFISLLGTFFVFLEYFKDYGIEIYHGGDNCSSLKYMGKDEIYELLSHFVKHGEEPYRGTDYNKKRIEDVK